jgi:hypothetical protein
MSIFMKNRTFQPYWSQRSRLFFWGCLAAFFIFGNQPNFAAIAQKTSDPSLFDQPTPQQLKPMGYFLFDVGFVYRLQNEHEFRSLTPGNVLHSGDYFKIIFTPTTDTFVYIFQIDSAGKIFRLFPMEKFGDVVVNNFNPAKTNQTYYIPAKDKSFVLDQQTGTETIYFLASQKRDPMLEAPLQQQAQNELAVIDQLLDLAGKMKNPATLTASETARKIVWQETGLTFSILQQRLENLCDGCVYILTFTHQ